MQLYAGLAFQVRWLRSMVCATGHRPFYPATNDFTGFNVTQPAPFPTFALPPFYTAAYPNQTSGDPTSPNYYATYTGASALRLSNYHWGWEPQCSFRMKMYGLGTRHALPFRPLTA